MDYYIRALELFRKKQWSSAQKVLQKGLLEVKKTPEAEHLLGVILFQQGFFKASSDHIQRACAMEKKPEYFLNLSIIQNELGQYEKAQQAYEKAFYLKNQNKEKNWKEEMAEKHLQTGRSYLKNNNLKAGLNEYVRSLEFDPKNIDGHIELAKILWKLQQTELALKHLKLIKSFYPHLNRPRFLLAEWYFEKKHLPLAVNEWESILRKEPKNKKAKNALLRIQQLSEWS